jgi:hypothetical protein
VSGKAIEYVKRLRQAPNGELIKFREKAVLLFLADAHNVEKGAAWNSVRRVAESFNITRRTVQQILATCVANGVIWPEERRQKDGRQTSNFWRFTEIDGGPTQQQRLAYVRKQIVGEMCARRTNEKKRDRIKALSTASTELVRKISLREGEEAHAPEGEPPDATRAKAFTPELPKEPPEEVPVDPPVVATKNNFCGNPELIKAQERLETKRRSMPLRESALQPIAESRQLKPK